MVRHCSRRTDWMFRKTVNRELCEPISIVKFQLLLACWHQNVSVCFCLCIYIYIYTCTWVKLTTCESRDPPVSMCHSYSLFSLPQRASGKPEAWQTCWWLCLWWFSTGWQHRRGSLKGKAYLHGYVKYLKFHTFPKPSTVVYSSVRFVGWWFIYLLCMSQNMFEWQSRTQDSHRIIMDVVLSHHSSSILFLQAVVLRYAGKKASPCAIHILATGAVKPHNITLATHSIAFDRILALKESDFLSNFDLIQLFFRRPSAGIWIFRTYCVSRWSPAMVDEL